MAVVDDWIIDRVDSRRRVSWCQSARHALMKPARSTLETLIKSLPKWHCDTGSLAIH